MAVDFHQGAGLSLSILTLNDQLPVRGVPDRLARRVPFPVLESIMQIKAAVARVQGAPLSIEALDIEDPRDNEILVKVVATGVCHTDLVVRDGMLPTPLPVVLGH